MNNRGHVTRSMLEVRDQRLRAFDSYAGFIEEHFVSDADGLIQSSDIEKLWFQWSGLVRFRDEARNALSFGTWAIADWRCTTRR